MTGMSANLIWLLILVAVALFVRVAMARRG